MRKQCYNVTNFKLQNTKWQKRTMLLKIEMQKLGGMIMILNPKDRHLNNVLKILNIIMNKKIMWHLAGRKTWTQTSNAVTVNSLGVWPVTRHALGLCIGQVGREIPWIGQWSAACCPSAPPGFPPPARSGPPRGRTSAPCRPSSRSGCGSPSSWSVCMEKGTQMRTTIYNDNNASSSNKVPSS